MVANGVADSFINTALQRRYESSAYARNFLERQITKTRGDLERSERALVAYAQQQGIINTGSGPTASRPSDAELAPGQIPDQAQQGACGRDRAAGRGRGRLPPVAATGPTSDVTAEHPGASAAARAAAGGLSAEAHVHEAGPSGNGRACARRSTSCGKQIAAEAAQMSRAATTACSPIIARRCRRSMRSRRASLSSRATSSTCAGAASSTHPAARGGHQPQPL